MDKQSLRESPYDQTVKKYENEVLRVKKVDSNTLVSCLKNSQSPGRFNRGVFSPASQQKQVKNIRQSSPQLYKEDQQRYYEDKENDYYFEIEERHRQLEQKMQQMTLMNEELNDLLLKRIEEVEKYKQERQKLKLDIQQYHQKIVQISEECSYYKEQKELFIDEAKQILEKKEVLYKKEYERQISQQKEQINRLTRQIEESQLESEQKEMEVEKKLLASSQSINQLQKTIKEKENVIVLQIENIESMKDEIKNYKEMVVKYKNLDNLSQQNEQTYKMEISQFQQQLTEMKTQINQLNVQIREKDFTLKDIEGDLRKMTILCNEKEIAIKQQTENCNLKYESLHSEYHKKIDAIKDLKQESERTLSEINRQHSMSTQQMEDKMIELISSIESTQQEFQKLQIKYDASTSLISEKEKKLSAQEEIIQSYQVKVQELNTQLRELQITAKQAESEKIHLKQDKEVILSQRIDFEKARNETKNELQSAKLQYEERIRRQQEAIQNYQREIEGLKIEIDKFTKERYAITSRTSNAELVLIAEQKKHDQTIKQLLSDHQFVLQNKDQIIRDREITLNKLQMMTQNLTSENTLMQKQLQNRISEQSHRELDNGINRVAYTIQRQSYDMVGSGRSGRSYSPTQISPRQQIQQSSSHKPNFIRYPGVGTELNRSFELLTENDTLNQKVLKRCKHIVGNY